MKPIPVYTADAKLGFAALLKPTLLSRPALTSLTKHLYAIYVAVNKEIKDHPEKQPDLAGVRSDILNTWSVVQSCQHQRAVAAAAKRDKGEVLWTVFKPYGTRGCLEIVRTPNRKITTIWYKKWHGEGYECHQGTEAERTEVITNPTHDNPWAWDFYRAMENDRK